MSSRLVFDDARGQRWHLPAGSYDVLGRHEAVADITEDEAECVEIASGLLVRVRGIGLIWLLENWFFALDGPADAEHHGEGRALTPREAGEWLRDRGLPLPADLEEAVYGRDASGGALPAEGDLSPDEWNIIDALAEGPAKSEVLGPRVGLTAHHARKLLRLRGQLRARGLVKCDRDDGYKLTPLGERAAAARAAA